MNILPVTLHYFFYLLLTQQPNISGTWEGKIADSQVRDQYDSVTIHLKLSLSADNKISGTSICYYANNYYKECSLSGKMYKKQDGFFIQEETITGTNFPNKPAIHIDRYDLTFIKEDSSRLNGEATCTRSALRCHENIFFSLKRSDSDPDKMKETNKEQ